ncbi:hypothetical protein [Azospirillum sp. SYSU D00513]|uniref:hypothetical protein n=1 Tax=Azospirillum sp. SYSU D00513 TaxID=2812561 RepID=UPI001A9746CC|nr:hypothetical protein [Azospirillum sp. SYSU D00513]
MLNACLRGKLRRSGNEGDDVRLLEDTTTATVFERLAYLPDATLIRVLFDPALWSGAGMPPTPRVVQEVIFWPCWPLPQAEDPRKTVEPDVAIEFDTGVLVIEAKRFDRGTGQKADQIGREWLATRRRYPGKPVWMLAVSGLRDGRAETVDDLRRGALAFIRETTGQDHEEDFRLGYASWLDLFGLVDRALPDQPEHRRLLRDLREGLAMHGVRVTRPVWLIDMLAGSWAGLRLGAGAEMAFPRWPRPFPVLDTHGGITTAPSVFHREGRS